MSLILYLNKLHKEKFEKYDSDSKEYLEFCNFYDGVTDLIKKNENL